MDDKFHSMYDIDKQHFIRSLQDFDIHILARRIEGSKYVYPGCARLTFESVKAESPRSPPMPHRRHDYKRGFEH
jgi:hypothetical protein